MVALATLTAAADQPSATSLLAALPNQAEVTRIGAEALAAWAHRLYAGPGYWNPLRPDLLAEQHLADTAQLPALATAAAQLAAGQHWEAGLLTQLLAELTRGAPNQPAVRAALDELLAAALPRIVDLAVTAGHAGTGRPGQPRAAAGAPARPGRPARRPDARAQRAARRARRHPHQPASHPVPGGHGRRRAGRRQPDLARSLNNLSVRLADLGRREDALAASQEAVAIYRELAAARPDAFRPDLARSLNNLSARPGRPGAAGGRAGRDRGSRRVSTGSWPRPARTRSGPTWPGR